MRKIIFALMGLLLIPFTSCNDDELDALKAEQEALAQRVLALETWQQQVNDNIASLKKLVESLEQRDYVTGVTPLSDGSGYIISFLYNGAVIIKNGIDGQNGADGSDGADGQDGIDGTNGSTPVIGVKLGDDGIYYWTIDGEWLYDANGDKVRASANDGTDGADDAIVITKLGDTTIALQLPDGFKEADYTAIAANVMTGENGDIVTRSYSSTQWVIKVTKPHLPAMGLATMMQLSLSLLPAISRLATKQFSMWQ